MFNRLPGAMLTLGHTHQWKKGFNAVLFSRRIPQRWAFSHSHVQSGAAGGRADSWLLASPCHGSDDGAARDQFLVSSKKLTKKGWITLPPVIYSLKRTNSAPPACSGALLNAEQERGGARPRKAPPAWILPGEGPTRLADSVARRASAADARTWRSAPPTAQTASASTMAMQLPLTEWCPTPRID